MIITIQGYPGSGKSTVARIIAKKLGYDFFSAGGMRREIALEKGLDIEGLNKIGEKEDWTDRKVDSEIERIGKTRDKFVIDGRVGYFFIPDSVKVFLKVELREGARRILEEGRKSESHGSILEAEKSIRERMKSDSGRYRKYYGIDNCFDEKNFDLVIDTTKITAEQAAGKILEFLNKK